VTIIILLLDTCLVPFIWRPAGSGTSPLWFPLRGYAKHPNRALQDVLPSEKQVRLVARNLRLGLTYLPQVYQVDRNKRKQADAGVRLTSSLPPSVVFEVGDSESLRQLRVDARLWLEDFPQVTHFLFCPSFPLTILQVQVVVLLTIDRPKIAIELWKALPCLHGTRSAGRTAAKVWSADWTNTATPMYILLSDIFRGDIPAVYGENLRVDIDTATLQQHIIDAWQYVA